MSAIFAISLVGRRAEVGRPPSCASAAVSVTARPCQRPQIWGKLHPNRHLSGESPCKRLRRRVEMSSSYTPATLEYLRVVEVPDLIRLGSKYDGGYVVPRSCVIESDMLLSFGISSDWNFEKDFHGLNRAAPIHAYDHTVSQKIFGRRAFVALLRALAKRTSFADFFGEWKTLSDWKKTAGIMNHHQRRVSNRAGHP